MSVSEDEDERLAQFLESEVLSETSDQVIAIFEYIISSSICCKNLN